ncbi:MAG: DedA family protein [Magnetococcales bacterium]|nr:DedA family protein [Magnetococcales bacterium]
MGTFEEILSNYGLLAILIGTFFEGETIVAVAGFLANDGILDPVEVAICAFLGSYAGDQFWFYLGRRFSNHRFVKYVTRRPTFTLVLAKIERNPILLIMSFRFIYGIRNITPVAIGLSRVSALKYLFFNGLAAAIWAASFTAIGYVFGHAVERVLGRVADVQMKILAALAVGIVIMVVFRVFQRRQNGSSKPPAGIV